MLRRLPVWVTKRKDRAGWWVGWRDSDGTLHQRRAGDTKKDAAAFAAEVDRRLNSWLGGAVVSWQQVKREFQIAILRRSQAHTEIADRVLASFERFILPPVVDSEPPGDIDARTILPRTIDEYLAGLQSRGKPASEHERLKHYAYLHACFNVAQRRGLIERNPVKLATRPLPAQVERRLPRDDRWVELLHAIPRTDISHRGINDPQGMHLLIVLAFTTGLRRNDLLALKVADIELGTAGTAHCGLVHARNIKARKVKIVGLPPVADKLVAKRISDLREGESRLFRWPRFPRHAWERLRTAAGLPGFHFHSLRAISGTAASIAALRRAGAAHLQHSSPQVYEAHYAQQDIEALEVASGLFVPALPGWADPKPSAERRPGRSGRRGRRGNAGNRRAASDA